MTHAFVLLLSSKKPAPAFNRTQMLFARREAISAKRWIRRQSFHRIRSVCCELLLLLLLLLLLHKLTVNSGESEYLCGTMQVVETSATRNSFYVRIIYSFRFSLSFMLFATIIALSNDMPLRLVNYIFVFVDRRPILPIRFVILCLWNSANSVNSSSRFLFLLRTCIKILTFLIERERRKVRLQRMRSVSLFRITMTTSNFPRTFSSRYSSQIVTRIFAMKITFAKFRDPLLNFKCSLITP